ncbi:MAG: nitroreductase family deazaflavin-dependent oxidoreductase [Phototrophicales bacterium]|nr:MAG: nitroreductase family deazaflavin-dependent oxidoreductase [Phototrophicales bacterium]
MDSKIKQALATDKTIDITTIGRNTGKARRIEIWFHNVDGRFYITGRPGKRDWYQNMMAHPEFTFHLKESVIADLAATARPITDEGERQAWFERYLAGSDRDVVAWIAESPLVEVTFVE